MPRFATILPMTLALGLTVSPNSVPAEDVFAFPETRPGQIAAAFFEAYHAGDDAIREFTQTWRSRESLAKRSMEERIAQYQQFSGMLGDLEPHSVLESSDHSTSILAFAESAGSWFEFTFETETGVPFKLSTMSIQPGTAPADAEPRVAEWTDLADLLRQTCEATGIPAMAAAIVEGGRITSSAAVGLRAIDATDPVELGDRFHIGSVTKSMTATLVGGLVEEGLLRWDLTVGEALKDVPMRDAYRAVTVAQLLRHRGGIQGYLLLDEGDEARLAKLPRDPTECRAAFMIEVLDQEQVAEPGTAMHYSNAGYALLGVLCERAAKEPWETLMRERLFEPLKLTSADIGWPAREDRPDQPRGHFGNPPDLRVQQFGEYDLGTYIAPAGDVSCSVEDLARYAAFHLAGLRGADGLLKAETVGILHDPGDVEGGRYAGGWIVDTTRSGAERHWHNGSAGTFFSMVHLLPGQNKAGVVLMNSGALANNTIAEEILITILEE